MNKQSAIGVTAIPRNPRAGSRLCKMLVLTVMVLAGIEVEAQAFANAGVRDQISEKKTATKQVRSYVCPMHPDVKSTKPGKCPKCKMDLRLERAVTNTAVTGNQNLIDGNAVAATNTSSNASGSATKMVIPDVEVLDQNGNAL